MIRDPYSRWGQPKMGFSDIREFLFFISSMLRVSLDLNCFLIHALTILPDTQGLCFLHERRIAHRVRAQRPITQSIDLTPFLIGYCRKQYSHKLFSL